MTSCRGDLLPLIYKAGKPVVTTIMDRTGLGIDAVPDVLDILIDLAKKSSCEDMRIPAVDGLGLPSEDAKRRLLIRLELAKASLTHIQGG